MATRKAAWQLTDRYRAHHDHKYVVEHGGKPVVNVTAISGAFDDGKAGAFAGAAVKLTRQGFNYRQVWDEKAERGSRIHAHMEAFMRDEEIDQRHDEAGHVDALDKWMVENDPTLIGQEEVALSRMGYGGRFDLISHMEAGEFKGKIGLIDLKTGRRNPFEHTLQLSAYRYADGTAIYGANGDLIDLKPLPHIDFAACLYTRDDGTFHFQEYPADETAWGMFLRLLDIYNYARSDTMKALDKAAKNAWKATVTA
jgi:hypothetical protein